MSTRPSSLPAEVAAQDRTARNSLTQPRRIVIAGTCGARVPGGSYPLSSLRISQQPRCQSGALLYAGEEYDLAALFEILFQPRGRWCLTGSNTGLWPITCPGTTEK